MKIKLNWKKIVTCCYPIYFISYCILLPFVMIKNAIDEGVIGEFKYSTFKKYNKEFRREHR